MRHSSPARPWNIGGARDVGLTNGEFGTRRRRSAGGFRPVWRSKQPKIATGSRSAHLNLDLRDCSATASTPASRGANQLRLAKVRKRRNDEKKRLERFEDAIQKISNGHGGGTGRGPHGHDLRDQRIGVGESAGTPLRRRDHVCDQGSFYVGGVPKVSNYVGRTTAAAQQITIGQMYVQFKIPKKRRSWPLDHDARFRLHRRPALDSPPDGQEGWLPYAVRNGIAGVQRGPAGPRALGLRPLGVPRGPRAPSNLRLIPTSRRHQQQHLDHLVRPHPAGGNEHRHRHDDPPWRSGRSQSGRRTLYSARHHGNYPPAFPIPPLPNSIDPAIEARGEPSAGAQSGQQRLPGAGDLQVVGAEHRSHAAGARPAPTARRRRSRRPNLGPRALAELVDGLGGASCRRTRSGAAGAAHRAHPEGAWQAGPVEGRASFPRAAGTTSRPPGSYGSDFDNIPFLMVNGDYRPLTTRRGELRGGGRDEREPDTRGGARRPTSTLETLGPRSSAGQTHMNMLGTNNLELFDYFLAWSNKNIDNPKHKGGCADGDDDRDDGRR